MLYQIPKNLEDAIKDDKLVIFAGAGTSHKLKLPKWTDLIVDVINWLSEANNDPSIRSFVPLIEAEWISQLEAISIIGKKYERDILLFVKDKLKIKEDADYSTHKKIISLSKRVVTTNFDRAFEKVSNDKLEVILNYAQLDLTTISDADGFIFKLHGDINDLGHAVFFESQYKELYKSSSEHASVLELKKLFTDKTLLFIGFSLSDPYINEIFTTLTAQYKGYLKTHFIITIDTNFKRSEHAKYISPICIDNYGQIDDVLDKMISLKASSVISQFSQKEAQKQKGIRGITYSNFIRREEEVENVLRKLKGNNPVVVIEGFPGVGKTSLAAEIAFSCIGESKIKYANSIEFEYVIWISPVNNPTRKKWLSIVFDSIARAMNNDKITSMSEEDLPRKTVEIQNCLQGNGNKILIVIDNFETINDEELLRWIDCAMIPDSTKFLITTSASINSVKQNIHQLEGLNKVEALKFIRQVIDNKGITETIPDDQFLDLIEVLKGNPKALELAIGCMIQGKLNLSKVKEDLENSMSDDFEKLHMPSWLNISTESKDVLSVFQLFLEATSLTREALKEISNLSDKGIDEALSELMKWHLISLHLLNQRYTIHPITLRFVKRKLTIKKEFEKRWYEYYLKYVDSNVRRASPKERYWNALVSDKMKVLKNEWTNILQVMQSACDNREDQILIDLIMLLVHFMDSRFYNQERIGFVNKAIEACMRKRMYYEEAILRIDALGWTYVEENRPEDAKDEILLGLKVIDKLPGKKLKDSLQALAYAWQARIMIEKGDTSEAEEVIRKADKLKVEAWIQTRINMVKGDLQFKKSNFIKALQYYKNAEELTISYGMEGHNYQIDPRIGLAYLGNGKLNEAEERFKHLQTDEDIAIGRLYGQYGLALVYYEKSKKSRDMEMKQNAINMIQEIEQELNCRTTSNLLHKLLNEFKSKRLKKIKEVKI